MRKLLIILSLFTTAASAQALDWLATIASSGSNQSLHVAADSSGNVISAGISPGGVFFTPGGGYSFAQGAQRYVYKLGSEREFLWFARLENGAGGTALAIDRNDDIFLGSGALFPATYITPAVGSPSTVFSENSARPALLWKLGSGGSTRWLREFPAAPNASVTAIAARVDGSIVVAGRFNGTIQLDRAPGSHVLTSFGGYDVFIVALDADAGFLWARQIGGAADDEPSAIVAAADGGIVLAGTFAADITVADDEGTRSVGWAGGIDGFLVRYDANGTLRHAGGIGGSGSDTIRAVDTDPAGKVLIAGMFSTVADLDPGPAQDHRASSGEGDIFVSLIDGNGEAVWTRTYGGGGNEVANAVRFGSGSVYVGGTFAGSVDFAPGDGGHVVTSSGIEDGFVLRLARDGGFERVSTYGGNSLIAGSDRVYGVDLDARGGLLVVGGYAETADFDPSPDGTYLVSNGSPFPDGYVWKLQDKGALMVSNAIGAPALALGQVSDVEITLTSGLDMDLTDLSIAQALPPILQVASAANATTTCSGALFATAGDNHFSLVNGQLAAGEACSVSVAVVAVATGNASVETPPAAFGNAQDVWPLATASVAFETGPAASTLQWTVHQPIASTRGQAVTFGVDVLSPGEEFLQPTGVITVSDGQTSCAIELPASTCQLTFSEVGTQKVSAVYPGDMNFLPSQAATAHDVLASADVAMAITAAPEVWSIGAVVGFNLEVANAGPDDASEIFVSALMTPFASVSWACVSGCTASGGGDVALTLALDAGEQAVIHVGARVADSTAEQLSVTALASPGPLILDGNTGNNEATHTAAVALFRDGFE